MKKLFGNLPFRLLLAVVLGILAGLGIVEITENPNFANFASFGEMLLNVIVCVKYVLGQFINFCVPLIIIGFIAPSITKLGKNASRMLGVAVVLAYASSVLAAILSMCAGFGLIPHLSIATEVNLRELPEAVFQLDIDQIMPVMSALVFSVLIGLATVWTKAGMMASLLEEFQKIVLNIVTKIVIPVLPFFIGVTFCTLAYEGTITKQLPVFIQVVLIVLVGHFIWMSVLYTVAGIYRGVSPFEVLKNYGPAYLTAVGTMSSAATLAVALRCAKKSKPALREDMIDFGIPLFANIHLCGSVLTEVFFVMTVSKVLYGSLPSFGEMLLFCFLLAIFAIGAPGVPGGTVMASLGLITGVLAFDAAGTALMLAVFSLQDSFGTACNVTGDGALTMILTGYAEKNKIEQQNISVEL